jgi:hypothetical protein
MYNHYENFGALKNEASQVDGRQAQQAGNSVVGDTGLEPMTSSV